MFLYVDTVEEKDNSNKWKLYYYIIFSKIPCRSLYRFCSWAWMLLARAEVFRACDSLLLRKFETGQTFSYVQTDVTTPKVVGLTMLGVVASICK